MNVIKFNAASPYHYEDLLIMLRARGAYLPKRDEMPAIGFIAYDAFLPIAAAFLRRVEGNFAQLDGLTSNPDLPSDVRNQGLDAVLAQALNKAKELGIKSVLGTTLDKNTYARAQRHGFVSVPMWVVVADTSRSTSK